MGTVKQEAQPETVGATGNKPRFMNSKKADDAGAAFSRADMATAKKEEVKETAPTQGFRRPEGGNFVR